jgi:hypothetical protein
MYMQYTEIRKYIHVKEEFVVQESATFMLRTMVCSIVGFIMVVGNRINEISVMF